MDGVSWLDLANRASRRVLSAMGAGVGLHRVGGVDVYASRLPGSGTGPPLLLVHGLGSSSSAFVRTMGPFARAFQEVWAVDLPGNGLSPVPPGGPLGLDGMVAVVRAFREEVIRRPVFLLGTSLGGALCATAAAEDPSAVAGLCLLAPAGARLSPGELDGVVQHYRLTSAREARTLARKLFHRAPWPFLALAPELTRMAASPAVRRFVDDVTPDDALAEATLARLTMPTLVIWGRSEKLLPYRSVHYFRAHLPGSAEIHEVSGFGHMPQVERPRAVVDRVVRFARQRGLVT